MTKHKDKITIASKPARNSSALSAKSRKSAGKMHDRREERGGAKNEMKDFISENDVLSDTYDEWKATRVVKNADILGGAAVFAGTRISILYIGSLALKNNSAKEILEDYPNLSDIDVAFAIHYIAREVDDTEEEHESNL